MGAFFQMLLQNAPDLVSARWILSSREKTRSVRNSLPQMAMGIRRKMIFYQRLDAYVEFLLCNFEQLLRRLIPQLNGGANILLGDDVREVVGKLPCHGAEESRS